ncbi:hypothetical protein [Mucilaginibacter dorajii]|uniref:Uncharacterized protein n=1 Tax=Mucilaginibacter dorajii TaxID=692994 RepID=A0ABP7Q4N1_9SPHI|nr:hypothetical protein [Mucilaginibacter dorajii]MCS3732625.1 uncharacterized protein (UPF0305 family) [Mucilaginibacter dorajii]
MITFENIEQINVIEESDLSKISLILFESLSLKRSYKNESVVNYSEYVLDAIADLFKKMLIQDKTMTKESKLNVINLLDKLKTQKENLELIRSDVGVSDIKQASKRLSKKSQSAFEAKL